MKDKKMPRPLEAGKEQEYADWAKWCNANGYRIMDDNPEYYYCKKAEIPQSDGATREIQTLKSRLSATDYQAIKYAEGEISEEEYEPIQRQRREWRRRINELENQMQTQTGGKENG